MAVHGLCGRRVRHLLVAKVRAGMPVQVEKRVGGELVSRSVVIADSVA